MSPWAFVDPGTAARRAGGRRRWNSLRSLWRRDRLMRVTELLADYGLRHGVMSRIARELGTSRQTIHRDVKAILAEGADAYLAA
jgi:transcriptional regulator of acetoin/glycerol metabolism